MTHVHTLRGRNSTLRTFVGGESHRGDAYTKGEKTFFEKTLIYFMLVFSLLYGALICFIALIASCLCVGHAFTLMLLCFIGCMFG